MEVRGSIISSIDSFVKDIHPDKHDEWMSKLSDSSKELLKRPTSSKWYPIEDGVLDPTKIMCDLFYNGDKQGAWKSGRYSAKVGLTGIYKVFVLISTPAFLMKRASRILATFYTPTSVEVVNSTENSMVVHFTELPAQNHFLESRIAGWMEQALEICGCKDLSLRLTRSIADGDDIFEVQISWR